MNYLKKAVNSIFNIKPLLSLFVCSDLCIFISLKLLPSSYCKIDDFF